MASYREAGADPVARRSEYDVARAFTTFYEACPVLKAEEPVRGNRLALCLLARTLAHGLDLLGVAAPERV